MQRSSSGMLPSISTPSTSGLGRSRSSQLVSQTEMDDDASFRDLEKGEKIRWRLKAEQAVHLIPVIIMACVLVLYIFSSVPLLDAQVEADTTSVIVKVVEKPALPERHLQQQVEGVQAVTARKNFGFSRRLQDWPLPGLT